MAFESIRLNSLSPEIFRASASEVHGTQMRADIINVGRLLMAERAGRDMNAMGKLGGKVPAFNSLMDGKGIDYDETNKKLQRNMLLYCAKQAGNVTGEEAPETFEEFQRMQRKYLSDRTFLRVLAGIITDIITPVLPAVATGAMDWFVQTVYTPMGKTYEVTVDSNDVYLFEDDSWGASRSKPANYRYAKAFTLNPTLRTAKAMWKWYQLVGNNADLGQTFNSIAAGMYSKITGLWGSALVAMSSNTAFVPSNMSFTYSNTNWITAAKRVALANNTSLRNVFAIGDAIAMSHVLPSTANGSNTNLDAALSTMLGVEWAKYGYLGDFMGIRNFIMDNALVPGTQNTTITEVLPTNRIWMMAAGAYKPVYVAFEEGTPITVEISPDSAADYNLEIIVSVSLDAAPICGSKISTISPI